MTAKDSATPEPTTNPTQRDSGLKPVTWVVAVLLVLNLAGSAALGVIAYRTSGEALREHIRDSNRVLSQTVRVLAERILALGEARTREEAIELAWQQSGAEARGRFLCFVGPEGRLTLHTLRPSQIGKDVSRIVLPRAITHASSDPGTIRDLLDASLDWSGTHPAVTGSPQIVSYSYSAKMRGLVAVHVPKQVIEQELHAGSVPWVLGMAGLTLVLLPLTFGVLHGALRKHEAILREAEAKRRQLELNLEGAQRLEAVGRLAGGIAHDFNNMLTVILSYAELLRCELETDSQREALGGMVEATERASELTGQLLAFGRRQFLRPAPLDVEELLERTVALWRPICAPAISLQLETIPPLGMVRADRAKLEQVFSNLILNARDAILKQGRISIRAETRWLSAEDVQQRAPVCPGRYVRIEITDDGLGMAEEARRKAFEPFFTTKPPGEGTGLGLAMVHGTITQSGGAVAIRSELGKGTTISLDLPALDSVPAALEPTDSQVRAGSGRILVVEDEPALRQIIERALREVGYGVCSAANGQDALELIDGSAAGFDLIVADVLMPRMTGIELAKALTERGHTLKFLFVSGYAAGSEGEEGGRLLGHPLLHKPFTVRKLTAYVAGLIGDPATPEP